MVSPRPRTAPNSAAPSGVRARTRGRPRFSRVCATIGALLAFTLPSVTHAAFEVGESGWEGASELLALARDRLGAERVEPLARLDFATLTPRDGVLILYPQVEIDQDQVSAFLSAGGRLALLDDHGKGVELLRRYRIYRIQAPLRPAATLRNRPGLAIALPAVQSVAGQEQNRHPVVMRVERLVTNHPTALTHPNLTPVLVIPALGEPDAVIAVTGIIAGRGRLFAMSDPSAVMNLMLRYPGNRAFAAGLVDYLVEDDTWGARGGKLYILSNRFSQTGRFARPGGVAGDLTEAADGAAEALRSWHEHGLPPGLARIAAALATLLAIGWAFLHALRGHRRIEPRYATPVPLLAQGGLPGRAAVLSAPTTDPALVMVELDSLFSEELASRAGLQPSTAPETALSVLAEQGAEPSLLVRARALFSRGRAARTAVLGRQPSRWTTGQVTEHARNVTELLAELDQGGQKAKTGEPGSA